MCVECRLWILLYNFVVEGCNGLSMLRNSERVGVRRASKMCRGRGSGVCVRTASKVCRGRGSGVCMGRGS